MGSYNLVPWIQRARWPLDIIESLEKGFLWKVSYSCKKAYLLANRQFLYVNLCCVFMIVGGCRKCCTLGGRRCKLEPKKSWTVMLRWRLLTWRGDRARIFIFSWRKYHIYIQGIYSIIITQGKWLGELSKIFIFVLLLLLCVCACMCARCWCRVSCIFFETGSVTEQQALRSCFCFHSVGITGPCSHPD